MSTDTPPSAAATRWVELAVALLIIVGGAIVVTDSYRVGVSWDANGPQAGYFPHIIGWLLTVVGAWIAVKTLFRWSALAGKSFVSSHELRLVLAMFVPTAVYVVLLQYIGIYVASALYIGAFMIWQGKYKLLPTVMVSVGVPVVMFLLFEIWFLVPLPKGPLEHWLGY
jgi:putative tricarboxylic transport membrane protein